MGLESSFLTLTLPNVEGGVGNGKTAIIAQAGREWMRVMVRNVSALGAGCRLADNTTSLQTFPDNSFVYILPAGLSDVFVLAPGQQLFASSASEAATISIHISRALPSDMAAEKRLSL